MRRAASIGALQMALQLEAFGRHLRHLRAQRGLTQDGAAHDMGVAPKSLHNWERGLSAPNPTSLRILSRFYGEPLKDLTSYIPDFGAKEPPLSRLDAISAKLDALIERMALVEAKLDQLLHAEATRIVGDAEELRRRLEEAATLAETERAKRPAAPGSKGRKGRAA